MRTWRLVLCGTLPNGSLNPVQAVFFRDVKVELDWSGNLIACVSSTLLGNPVGGLVRHVVVNVLTQKMVAGLNGFDK